MRSKDFHLAINGKEGMTKDIYGWNAICMCNDNYSMLGLGFRKSPKRSLRRSMSMAATGVEVAREEISGVKVAACVRIGWMWPR